MSKYFKKIEVKRFQDKNPTRSQSKARNIQLVFITITTDSAFYIPLHGKKQKTNKQQQQYNVLW